MRVALTDVICSVIACLGTRERVAGSLIVVGLISAGCASKEPALVSASNLFVDSEVNPYDAVPSELQCNTAADWVGPLLWPAAVLHAAITIAFVRQWLVVRR